MKSIIATNYLFVKTIYISILVSADSIRVGVAMSYIANIYFKKCIFPFSCRLYGVPFVVAFLTPVTMIIVGNIVAFCFIIRSLLTSGNKVTSIQKTSGQRQARQGIAIMVLLGLTWIFGMLAIDEAKVTFQYLFCIFNTLQGLFVFIFFGILPSGTRIQLRGVFQRADKAAHRADQLQDFKEQNPPSNNLAYSSNELSGIPSTNEQSIKTPSLDESVTKTELAKSDDVRVEDKHSQNANEDFKFPNPIQSNSNVARHNTRKDGSNYTTTIELNLNTNLSSTSGMNLDNPGNSFYQQLFNL